MQYFHIATIDSKEQNIDDKYNISCIIYCNSNQPVYEVYAPICLSMSAASSGVARGIIPGSLKVVRSKVAITKKKMRPSATGIAGDTFTARYGQLKA